MDDCGVVADLWVSSVCFCGVVADHWDSCQDYCSTVADLWYFLLCSRGLAV